jgi:mannitol operon repressor
MRADDVEYLSGFLDELQRETDRGLPLVGAALIDERIQETLRSFFCVDRPSNKLLDSANAPLGTFSSRIQACYSLGLIDDHEYAEIELIRKIRNEFAHAKHGMSFRTEKIKGFCSTLRSDLPEGGGYPTKDARFRFTNAVVSIVTLLYYRPDCVALERRKSKTWAPENEGKWISDEDKLPQPGESVLVIGRKRQY